MSRSLTVTRRKRIRQRGTPTAYTATLDIRVMPLNPERGAADVPYDGAPKIELPNAEDITISNRSGDRKKI